MKNHITRQAILIILFFGLFAIKAAAQNDTTIVKKDTTITNKDTTLNLSDTIVAYKDSMRGQRYCEIVLVKVNFTKITADVFNTLGCNACPEELWKNINTDKLKKEFSVHTVVANGPRYYLMDKIATYSNDTTTTAFDSLQMKEWAKIHMSISTALSLRKNEMYKERPFKMNTEKIFNKGSVVFELTSPEHTYIMESYCAEVDSTLKESDLPNLQQRLTLPQGWQYKVVTLDNDLHLITADNKEAFGIEDELGNRYQRVE